MSEGKRIPIYGGSDPQCSDTVTSKWSKGSVGPAGNECGMFVAHPIAIQGNLIGRDAGGPHGVGASDEGAMYTLTKADVHGVAHPVPYDLFQITAPVNRQNRKPGDPCHTLARDNAAHAAVATFQQSSMTGKGTIGYDGSGIAKPVKTQVDGQMVHHGMAVRRLTPVECERLQGFPDGYTAIPWRKKTADECPDGPRYRALGNSMAVNCMEWIGERIVRYESR